MGFKSILLPLASMMALGLASCASDELKEAYQEGEISFTTRVSRATPTRLDNLDGFRVYAQADDYTEMFIKGDTARKSGNTGNYAFDKKKFTWPSGVNKIKFWAYGPLAAKVRASIQPNTQMLTDVTVVPDLKAGGQNHQDIVVAYTEAERSGISGMQVPLVFHHALSQVEVRIKKGDGFEDGRVVKVRGAWIVNVHKHGDLEFNLAADNNHMVWATQQADTYGRQLGEGTRLGNGLVEMISNGSNGGGNSSLMLIPQAFEAYEFNRSGSASDDGETSLKPNYNDSGTYILVLCRVETEHKFAEPTDGSASEGATGPLKNDNGEVVTPGHVHQLFPVSTDASGNLVYREKAYGYTCVPIGGEWIPGKKYVYTLEFCGHSSGAGVYPPDPGDKDFPEGLPDDDVEPRPDGKKPGDPVLDKPISFTVTVAEWVEEKIDTPMP